MNAITSPGSDRISARRTMQAAVYRRFGGPDVVCIERRPVPRPARGEVLMRVRTTTVSAADHRARAKDLPRGLGLVSAAVLGVFRPRLEVLGMDAAGVVEAVGPGVSRFAVGDEVVAMLGARFGGHAEYATVPESGVIARKPAGMDFEEAVALVFGGVTAHAFLSRAGMQAGTRVLVNGASGAVGTAAVQLAAAAGAHVTAVTSGGNAAFVRSLGADRVVDYRTTDFAAEGRRYDVIVDAVGNAPFARVDGILVPGGALLQVTADLRELLLARYRSRRSGRMVVADVPFTAADIDAVVSAGESGRLRPIIDRTVSLADIVEAHRHVDRGRKRGSVVVRVVRDAADVASTDRRAEQARA
jgi:NADPH:quinone reductase-like Zn-dependent oxidoreductase